MWTDLSFEIHELDIGPNMKLNISHGFCGILCHERVNEPEVTSQCQLYNVQQVCVYVHTPQHTHTGSAVALQMPWDTQEWAWDVKSLVCPFSQGSEKSKLHQLCCWCIDDVTMSPVIPARIIRGRVPPQAQRGKGRGFLQEQDLSPSLAR